MATIQTSSHISVHGKLVWSDGVRATVEHAGKAYTGTLLLSRTLVAA